MQNGDAVKSDYSRYESVKDYYSNVLRSSKDLKTSACTAGTALQSVLVMKSACALGSSYLNLCEQVQVGDRIHGSDA
jgi:hypothetical protein